MHNTPLQNLRENLNSLFFDTAFCDSTAKPCLAFQGLCTCVGPVIEPEDPTEMVKKYT